MEALSLCVVPKKPKSNSGEGFGENINPLILNKNVLNKKLLGKNLFSDKEQIDIHSFLQACKIARETVFWLS